MRTCRTGDRNAPIWQGINITGMVSSTPSFEELEMTPDVEDKQDLIVTMLQMISEQKEQNGEKYSLLQGLGQQHLFAEQLYDKSHKHCTCCGSVIYGRNLRGQM